MTRAYGMNLLGAIEKPATPQKLRDLIARHGATPARGPARPPPAIPAEDWWPGLARRPVRALLPAEGGAGHRRGGGRGGARALATPASAASSRPGLFIPALEDGRRVDDLTWVMLERSAAVAAPWLAAGQTLAVSVNLSLTLAERSDARRSDHRAPCERQGLGAGSMILEITETAAMTDVGRCLENLARLRVKGFGLSIDDYGTGYSSMQQLARIPFTELKLDQSFVTNCAMNVQHRAIIESSLDMARRLKLKTVAEGVETHADWTLLRELGCALGQGYFIAKPMAADEFLGWAALWRAPAA